MFGLSLTMVRHYKNASRPRLDSLRTAIRDLFHSLDYLAMAFCEREKHHKSNTTTKIENEDAFGYVNVLS